MSVENRLETLESTESIHEILHRLAGATGLTDIWHQGRYVDVFERRGGECKILNRVVLIECQRWLRTADLQKLVTGSFQATAGLITQCRIRHRSSDFQRAWVGFNASHSSGAMLVAGIYIPLTASYFNVIQGSVWFSTLPVLIGISYLILAKKYWFNIPFIGIHISTLCFSIAAVLINT